MGIWPRTRALSIMTAVGLLGVGGVAAAQNSWLVASAGNPPASEVGAYTDVEAPVEEPIERTGSDLATVLSQTVADLPDFPGGATANEPMEVSVGDDRMVLTSFVAIDGGLMDVVMQRLRVPLSTGMIDPSGASSESLGPDGESVLVLDKGHTLQVIAIDPDGVMANIIIERINRLEPSQPSEFASVSADRATEWALTLLELFGGDL